MKKINVTFMGTPDFAVPTLKLLHLHQNVNIISVITMPDRPAGRGKQLKTPPVAEYAKLNNLPLLQTGNINNENEYLDTVLNNNIDIIIVLAFAQFLKNRLLSIPSIGCFNIHTSLLPKYRGAAPIQYALLNGDSITGVSIQKMIKKMDAGDIAISKEVNISDSETYKELYTKLMNEAALASGDFITQLLNNNISYLKQNEADVTFAPTLKKQNGYIDFISKTSSEIYNQVRALNVWPGTFCFINNKRVKILEVSIESNDLCPGTFCTDYNSLLIGCKNSSLRLKSIQLESKKICSDTEYLNGTRDKTFTLTSPGKQ